MGEANQIDASSVTTLNGQINQHFKDIEQFSSVQCHGEVTDVSIKNSNIYLYLIDVFFKLKFIVWSEYYAKLDVTICDGMGVIVDGNLWYYSSRGELQLHADDVTVVGTGTQTTVTEQLEADLGERGWFDETQKTSLPNVPERIGVVTSLNGDAQHDITTAIRDKTSAVDIILQHATVQGTNAPQPIADGIHRLDQDETVDVMIVGRGGGSMTDL